MKLIRCLLMVVLLTGVSSGRLLAEASTPPYEGYGEDQDHSSDAYAPYDIDYLKELRDDCLSQIQGTDRSLWVTGCTSAIEILECHSDGDEELGHLHQQIRAALEVFATQIESIFFRLTRIKEEDNPAIDGDIAEVGTALAAVQSALAMAGGG